MSEFKRKIFKNENVNRFGGLRKFFNFFDLAILCVFTS